MGTALIVGIFYSLDALYGERRDRSILFWKSLPVSDLTAVLSKLTVPLFILPLLSFAITIATQFVMLLLSSAILLGSGANIALAISLHRWIGRVFFVTALGLSVSPISWRMRSGLPASGSLRGSSSVANFSESGKAPTTRSSASWALGATSCPLAVLELYRRAKESAGPRGRFATAGGLAVLTVLMGIGIFAFTIFTWQRRLART